MKLKRSYGEVVLSSFLKMLNDLKSKKEMREFIEIILEYVSKGSNKLTDNEIKDALKNAVPEIKGGEIMQTLAETWFSKGEKKGREDGKEEGNKEGKKEGKEEGKKEGILATAVNMIKVGLDMSVIKQVTGLTDQKLQKLARQ